MNANDRQWPGSAEVASASWVERHTVNNRQLVTALEMDLDHGEAEAIALAIQLGANVVLLDEHEGRRIAQRHQLPVVEVVGILLDAKQNGYIDKVMPYVEDLHQVAGFYLSSRIIDRVRRLAGESR